MRGGRGYTWINLSAKEALSYKTQTSTRDRRQNPEGSLKHNKRRNAQQFRQQNTMFLLSPLVTGVGWSGRRRTWRATDNKAVRKREIGGVDESEVKAGKRHYSKERGLDTCGISVTTTSKV